MNRSRRTRSCLKYLLLLIISSYIFLASSSLKFAQAFNPDSVLDGSKRPSYACPSFDSNTCSDARKRYLTGVIKVMCHNGWNTSLSRLIKQLTKVTDQKNRLLGLSDTRKCSSSNLRSLIACRKWLFAKAVINLKLNRLNRILSGISSDLIRECNQSASSERKARCSQNTPANVLTETEKYCRELLPILQSIPKASPDQIINAILKAVNQRCQDASDEYALFCQETPTPTPTPDADVRPPSGLANNYVVNR